MTNPLELIRLCEQVYERAALSAGPDKIFGASVSTLADGTLAVAFRGTLANHDAQSLLSWLNDFRASLTTAEGIPGRVHAGFLAGYEALSGDVFDAIEGMQPAAATPDPWWQRTLDRILGRQILAGEAPPTILPWQKKILFTGHSFGGALAQLAGVRYAHLRPQVIVFASPLVGDLAFAAGYPGEVALTRYEAADDIVPWLPPWGYRAAGEVVPQLDMPARLRRVHAHALMADLLDPQKAQGAWQKVANAHHLSTTYRPWLEALPLGGAPQAEAA